MFLQLRPARHSLVPTNKLRRTAFSAVASIAAGALLLLGAPLSAAADEAPPPEAVSADTPVAPAEETPAAEEAPPDAVPADEPAPPAEEAPDEDAPAGEAPAEDAPAEEAPTPDVTPPTEVAPEAAGSTAEAVVPSDVTVPDAPEAPPADSNSPRWAAVDIPAPSANRFAALEASEYDPPTLNPPLPEVCGLDFSLVLDQSGSIGADGIANLKDAADAFTDALKDTGSRVSVVSFEEDSDLLQAPIDLTSANLSTIQDSYAGLTSDGWTNWEGGLDEGETTFGGFGSEVELMIVITDGNPNTTNSSSGGEFSNGAPEAVNPAVAVANSIKGGGTHMFVVAVGDSISTGPIEAISGGEAFDGSNFATADYMTTEDYSTLAASLAEIAEALCGGTVKIHKSVEGWDAEGWSFSTATTDVTPTSDVTGADGWTDPFAVEGYGDEESRTVSFTEEDRADFTLESVECATGQSSVPIDHVEGSLTWTVPVAKNAIVDCYVVNKFTPPPAWELTKSAWPWDGSIVAPGDTITYYLDAVNTSDGAVVVADAMASDDLSGVLEFADLDELGDGLSLEGEVLTWEIPDLAPPGEEGDSAYTWFTVSVKDNVLGELIHNAAEPGPGGECPVVGGDELVILPADVVFESDCETVHHGVDVDLLMDKSAEGGPVSSGSGDLIDYTLVVTNEGKHATIDPIVTDTLPAGVTLDGDVTVVTDPVGNETNWTLDTSVPGAITATYDGSFGPDDTATFTFAGLVGDLEQADPMVPVDDLVNVACVEGFRSDYSDAPTAKGVSVQNEEGEGELIPDWDTNSGNNCDDATTPVKSIAMAGLAQCVNDTPWFNYSVAPFNIGDPAANPIALIWWTQAAYDGRNPAVDASDEAGLLADGASQVDYIAYPAGWASGDVIEGSQLWPGAAVDLNGNPTAWPGWTKLANGTWVIDPAAPFYELRGEAVVEIRINPSNDASVVYPPTTPNCNAAPDQPKPSTPAGLPRTGAEPSGLGLLAGLLILTGVSAVAIARRRMLQAG